VRNVALTLEYDGTAYHGFQVQLGQQTVQGVLEDALGQVTGAATRVYGAGRTDAGVHAAGQVVSFRSSSAIPASALVRALNAILPGDVVVTNGWEATDDFHARFSARGRGYRYSIWNSPVPTALRRLYAYHWRGRLDVDAMQVACSALVGTRDFASFAGAGDGQREVANTVRTVLSAHCGRDGDLVEVDVAANAFLPHMVRNIVGTLLWVGSGKIDPEGVSTILAGRNRALAGPAAPARGLCLTRVWYAESG